MLFSNFKFQILFFSIIPLLFALPTIDPDFGWFYRCGHTDCSTNTFSVFLPNYHWTRPMIIYPRAIAFIFDHFSFNGLTILNMIIGLSSFYFFHKIIKTSLTVSASAFIISTLLSFSTLSLGLRNQSLSLLFFLTTIYLLTRKGEKTIFDLCFLIFNFFLWSNLHPSFPVGLIIIAFYAIIHPAGAAFGGIIAGLSTLINPSGIYIYQDIFSHFQIPMNTLIAEWVPPNPPQIIFIIFLTIISALIILFSKKNLKLFFILSLAFTAVLSISARRNLPFFYYFLPIALLHKKNFNFLNNNIYYKFFIIPSFLAAVLAGYFILPNTIDINTNWNSYCHKGITNFPCEAVEVLKQYPIGNIFHTYEWGGFLIWQLPQFKTFVDGRAPAWKTANNISPYLTYLYTYQTQPGWQKTLEEYKIDYILISPGTFLDLELKKNQSSYKEIFKSEFSVLYQTEKF